MNFKSKRFLITLLVLAVVAGVSGYYWQRSKTSVMRYRQERASRGPISITVLSTGTVEPENRVDVKPPIAGRAEQVLVSEGDKVRKGQTLIWMSSTERAALLDAARARGPEELKRWEELYRPTPILAPVSGTIIARAIEPGQTFATTDAILAMSDRLIVQAQVDETDIAQIRPQQPATIVLDAYPEDQIKAHVLKIAYEAKTVNNVTTYVVTVVPEAVPDFMRSGMTANVTFKVNSRENALLIPSEAIKYENGKPYVFVPSSEPGVPQRKFIEVGLSDGKQTEVAEGLKERDVVLIPTLQSATTGKGQQGSNPFGPSMRKRR